jgi:hypothetical protein
MTAQSVTSSGAPSLQVPAVQPPQLCHRYLRLAFDGIRSQTSEPLPNPLPARLEFTDPDPVPAVNSKTH